MAAKWAGLPRVGGAVKRRGVGVVMSEIAASHQPVHPRLRGLPTALVMGRRVPVAWGGRSRLLGLAGLDRGVAGRGLLIPRCRGIHTFGMRFTLDLVFLDGEMRPIGMRSGVGPHRLAGSRAACAVLELPAAGGGH